MLAQHIMKLGGPCAKMLAASSAQSGPTVRMKDSWTGSSNRIIKLFPVILA